MTPIYTLLGLLAFVLVAFFFVAFQRNEATESINKFKNEAVQKGYADWKTDGEKIEFVWKTPL